VKGEMAAKIAPRRQYPEGGFLALFLCLSLADVEGAICLCSSASEVLGSLVSLHIGCIMKSHQGNREFLYLRKKPLHFQPWKGFLFIYVHLAKSRARVKEWEKQKEREGEQH